MFETLVVSGPIHRRGGGQAVVSILFHTVLLGSAIRATRGAAETHELPQRPASVSWRAVPPSPTPAAGVVVAVSEAGPQAFQPAVPPLDLPLDIPPIDVAVRPASRGWPELGIASNEPAGVIGATPGPGEILIAPAPYRRGDVDEPARWLGGPAPVYPTVMHTVGIDGVVRLRFVVGIDSTVEAATMVVLSSTNRAFERNAIDAVLQAVFRPARVGGRLVRQLVEQNVRFRLGEK